MIHVPESSRRVGSLGQFLQRQDGRVLRAVRSGHQGQHRSRSGPVNHNDRDARGRIHSRRYGDIAGGLLPAARGRRADREIGGCPKRRQQRSY